MAPVADRENCDVSARGVREPRFMIRLMNVVVVGGIVASMAIVAKPAQAGFSEGMAAFARGDMATAVRELVPAARADDSRAQFLLAQIYARTDSAPKERADAVMWYRRAAANGMVAAMRRLGDIYRDGLGAESDPVQAYAWYDLASSRLGPHRGSFGRFRDDVASKMPPPALDHARLLARYWRGDFGKIGVMIPPPLPPPDLSSPVEVLKPEMALAKTGSAATDVRERIRRVQAALAARGYEVGPVDGIVGSRTSAAIRAFQSDQGLAQDGRVSAGLIERLEGDAEGG